jgi:hypothetical protein
MSKEKKVYIIGFKLDNRYFIQIGVTEDISNRVKQLNKKDTPFSLEAYFSIKDLVDPYQVKQDLYKHFAAHKVKNGWLTFSYSLIEFHTLLKEALQDITNQSFEIVKEDILNLAVNLNTRPQIITVTSNIFKADVDKVTKYISKYNKPISYAIEQLKLKKEVNEDYTVNKYLQERRGQLGFTQPVSNYKPPNKRRKKKVNKTNQDLK